MGFLKNIGIIILVLFLLNLMFGSNGTMIREQKEETKSLMQQCIDASNPSTPYETSAVKTACYQLRYYGGDEALIKHIKESEEENV